VIANRTLDRGEKLASQFGGEVMRLAELPDRLHEFDVVVSCTASSLPLIGLGAVERALQRRRHRPIFMVDLAVPRDIEPEVKGLDDVYLYSVDDLSGVVQTGQANRQAAVAQAEAIIDAGVQNATKQNNTDITITVTAPSATASAATSTAYISAGTTWSGTNSADSTSISAAATASTTPVAIIRVDLKNASGVQTYANESITASTNIGTLGGGTGATGGGSVGRTVIFNMTAGSSYYIAVYPDGTAGTATINVSTPSVTFSAKTVSFYATAVSSITATQRLNTLNVGSTGNSSAISAVVKDSAGNTSNGTVYAYSSNLSVVSDSGTACAFDETNGRQQCTLTGVAAGTATITLKSTSVGSIASTVVSSAAISVTVNNLPIAKVTLATDKTSYAPGEKGYILVGAVDANGKSVGSGTKTALLATGGVSSSAQLGSSTDTLTGVDPALASSEAPSFVSTTPVKVYTFYAPTQGGEVTLTATGGAGAGVGAAVAVTTKFTVTDNAATALAAVTALASQVSAFITKINAQITTLTDLVMKIQKKVKA